MKLHTILDGLRRLSLIAALVSLATVATAQTLPAYYPKEGFQRTGNLDAVMLQERRIVINDIPYWLADNVIVHSPRAYSIPVERLRPGLTVAVKTAEGRRITQIWLLPRDYRSRR